MLKPLLLLAALGIITALFLAGCKATRGGYESAPYKVVRKSGGFEVRDYPALTLVETPMRSGGSDNGFSRLFGYITGGNAEQQKIAMTTPVFMNGNDTNTTMAFVMPADMASNKVPQPKDGSVKVREVAAGRFAVFRYSGGRNQKKETEAVARLKDWMSTEHLALESAPVFGYFDPPWTPAFLRRNEVMIRTPSTPP